MHQPSLIPQHTKRRSCANLTLNHPCKILKEFPFSASRWKRNYFCFAENSFLMKIMKHWSSRGTDLDKAAAIENDETMIINSDHSIITTPVESPQDVVDRYKRSPERKMSLLQVESDETPTSDTSSSEAVVGEKNKRHRPKARSESNRSEKYAKILFFVVSFLSLFNWLFISSPSILSSLVRSDSIRLYIQCRLPCSDLMWIIIVTPEMNSMPNRVYI